MAVTPNFQLGRAMTSLVLTPVSIAADGTYTDTTPVATFTGVLETFEYTTTNELEEISAVTARRQNNMITSTGSEVTIEVLMKAGVDSAYAINTIGAVFYGTTDFVRVTIVQYSLNWGPFYGVMKSFQSGIKGKGKVTAQMQISQIDPNVSNPAVT